MPESSDDEEETITGNQNGFIAMKKRMTQTGYREGVSSGRDHSYQSAFDLGFQIGFRSAFERGKYRQFFNCLAKGPSSSKSGEENRDTIKSTTEGYDLIKELEIYWKCLLPLPPIELKPTEFERKDRRNTLESLSKMAMESFSEFDKECQNHLPRTYSLLNIKFNSHNNYDNSVSSARSQSTLSKNDKPE